MEQTSGDISIREAAILGARRVSVSSFVMAVVFAYSASVQLNDIDWYLWLPLYSLACFVCLANTTNRFLTKSRTLSHVGLIAGAILLVKVVLEGCYEEKVFMWKDFISLDMNKRLVREKLGSLLVCLSMWSCTRATGSLRNKAGKTVSKTRSGLLLPAVGHSEAQVAMAPRATGVESIHLLYPKKVFNTTWVPHGQSNKPRPGQRR